MIKTTSAEKEKTSVAIFTGSLGVLSETIQNHVLQTVITITGNGNEKEE